MHAPTSAAIISATSRSLTSRAMTSMVAALMVDTPQASPSSPSMKLTELVIARIHTTVTGMDSIPSSQ